jgi:glutaredoxin
VANPEPGRSPNRRGSGHGADNSGMSPLLRRRDRGGKRTVTLIGKPGCHLCDDARRIVATVCQDLNAEWEEKDITQDEALNEAYWEQIPVVLIDGEPHTFWRVDPDRLRRALGA